MKLAQHTAATKPHRIPSGFSDSSVPSASPLANTVPARMTATDAKDAAWGRFRVQATSKTSPIQVNWNSSAMATLAGRSDSDR